ncbi:MAG: hypothetical protein ABJB74_00345 [Gemmatimonas sp.]
MTTRPPLLQRSASPIAAGLLLLSIGASSAPEADASNVTPARTASRCVSAELAIETDWGATGEWRVLPPVPAPREASPTNHTGTWVERWHPADGSLEVRQVSAAETRVAVFANASCTPHFTIHRRTYNADSLRDAFTDAVLDSVIHANARGMLYVWSPRMPLSLKALPEARAAAKAMGIAFTAVVAEANNAEVRELAINSPAVVTAADQQRMESLELVYRNATIHYPTALFYRDGHIVDGVYPGYKNSETFAKYGAEQFAKIPDARFSDHVLRSANDDVANSANTAAFWVDHKARVTNISAVNTPRRIGFFFKPITGTSLVSYNAQSIDYFFDIKTSKEIRVPGHIDPVPTPDGRFLTLPGLQFLPVPSLVAGNQQALYVDPALPDEYQTASILSETKSAVRYRVVTGWNAGARFRDYEVALDAKGVPTGITPASELFVPCQDRLLTLPINAKSGREFGAYDTRANTNVVLEVTDATHCALKLDLGFASGKLSFSYDGAFIAFATSRINTDAEGELMRPSESMYKDALVLERKTGRIINLSQNAPIMGMTFPEFQKDRTVMLLDQYGPGRPVEQLKVISFK